VSRRRALHVIAVASAIVAVHLVLVRAMAHGHVAHVLLGAGNAAPPAGAALLALSLVLVRFAAMVLVPGAVLAATASLIAQLVRAQRPGTGTSSGAGTSSDDAGSANGAGASIDGRGTK
jgi:hypothetical protein